MKEFTAKTVEEAVAAACAALSVEANHLVYVVTEEKKGLFRKSATISVYEDDDAAAYAEEYLKTALKSLGVDAETESVIEDGIIKVTIDSDSNPILIGKGGKTLQALNEVTKFAVSTKFRKRYRILLDVGGYKEDKYDRVSHIAKRTAKTVLRTHIDAQLDPMTPDERRVVHNALSDWEHIKTESSGEGADRAVTIKYVD